MVLSLGLGLGLGLGLSLGLGVDVGLGLRSFRIYRYLDLFGITFYYRLGWERAE